MSMSLFSTSQMDTSTAFMMSPRTSALPSAFPFSPDGIPLSANRFPMCISRYMYTYV
jgi:hypothetical protein